MDNSVYGSSVSAPETDLPAVLYQSRAQTARARRHPLTVIDRSLVGRRGRTMELMQLEMFVAVVEEGSVNKAGSRVFRTPPAVSAALRKLEEEIGTPLLDRSQRLEYELTEAGEVLYKYAVRVLGLLREATSAAMEIGKVRAGELRIGASESSRLYLLPKVLLGFRKHFPDTKIEIICQHRDALLTQIKHQRLEIALLSLSPDDADLESRLIMRDELVLITSTTHHLSARRSVQIAELGQERLILESTSSRLREIIVEAFAQCQTPLRISVENAPVELLKNMVALGIGVGFVPLMCVAEEVARGELKMIRIEQFHADLPLWLVRRRTEHSEAARVFTALTEQLFQNLISAEGHSNEGGAKP
jgi:DNA-binding transcriptional LysR family regulator